MSPPGPTPRPTRTQSLGAARRLASPDAGRLGQGIRFAIAGAVVTVVYVATTTLLVQVFGVDFQVALATGYLLGLCFHFTLQRVFVWVHHEEFVLSLASRQGATSPGGAPVRAHRGRRRVAALSRTVRPGVYFAAVVVVTAANFLIFAAASSTPLARTARCAPGLRCRESSDGSHRVPRRQLHRAA